MNSVKFGYTPFASHVIVKLNVKAHPNCSLDVFQTYETLEITPLRSRKTPTLIRIEGFLTYEQHKVFLRDLKDLRLRTRLQEAMDALKEHNAYCDAVRTASMEDDDLPF
jgi:hypothetical protein